MEHVNNIYTTKPDDGVKFHENKYQLDDSVESGKEQIERQGYKFWNPRKFAKTDYFKPSDMFFAFASAIVALYLLFIVSGSMVLLSGSLVGNTSLASGFGAFLADSGIWMANIAGWTAGVGAAVYVVEKACKFDPPKQKALENAKNLIESKLFVELNALSKDIVLGKKDLTTIRSHLDIIVDNVRNSIPKNGINTDKLNDAFVSILGKYKIEYNNSGIDTATFTNNFKMQPVGSGVTLENLYEKVKKAYNLANNKEETAILDAEVGQKIKFTLLQKFLGDNKNKRDDVKEIGGANKELQNVTYQNASEAFNMFETETINKQFLHDDLVKAIKKTEETIDNDTPLKTGLNLDTSERSRRRGRGDGVADGRRY